MLVAGCDRGDDIGEPTAGPSSGASSSPSPTAGATSPSPSGAAAATPDEALVAAVVAQLTSTLTVLATSRQVSSLRAPLLPAVRAHRRHLEVLEGDPAAPTREPRPEPVAALRAARRGEQELQAVLVDAAARAESGALAKLLASMSASTTQLLVTLPTGPGR